MTVRLVVLDIDGTLAASPPCDGRDWQAWEAALLASQPEAVPGAAHGVLQLLKRHSATPVLLTARRDRLRRHTEDWLKWHMPFLVDARLCMRAEGDERSSFAMKRERLQLLRRWRPGGIVLADDDVAARALCLPGDTFLHAPECWRTQ